MHGIAGRRLLALITLGLLAAGVFLASRLLQAKGLVWATNVTTIAAFVLAAAIPLVPFVGKLLGWVRGAPSVAKITLQQARTGFAEALSKQWAEEDQLRRVYDPWPLPVRWQVVSTGPISPQSAATEQFTDIHAAFTQTPAGRMVILGAAGAGKSVLAIKLVQDLLADRAPEDPVPILLAAATWTRDCAMTEWITEQLVGSQPSLDVQIRTDTGEKAWLPRALVDSGMIAVIDGLDELPPDRRTEVITEINRYGSNNPLVLTSRPEEYYAAVATREVSKAVVIELDRLEVPDVKRYLVEGTAAPSDRWQRVFDRLGDEPGGALALTLATPLMVWLTRTVYEKGVSDPGELLDPAWQDDRQAIESHLIAAFVPAVYSGRRRRSRPRSFRCTPEQATRWLGFLANRLNRTQTQEIAWWRLSLAEPGFLVLTAAVRAVLYTCVAWQVIVWALTRRGYWRHGTYVGHGHYQDLLLAGPLGHAIRPLTNAWVRSVLQSDVSSNLAPWRSFIDGAARSLAHVGLFRLACIGACLGIIGGIIKSTSKNVPVPQTLRMTWRRLRWQVFGPLPWLLTLAFFWWYAARNHQAATATLRAPVGQAVLLWLGIMLVNGVARSLIAPIGVASKADPVSLLRADRHTYLVRLVRSAAAFGTAWLWLGIVLAMADGAVIVAGLFIVLLLGSTTGAWTRYLDARLRLAVRGRLPWRTISFLNDAHRRGVLRQTGAVYQFRHIRLQEQLATDYSPWPRPFVPVATWISQQLARRLSQAPDTGVDQADPTEYIARGEVPVVSPRQGLGALLLIVALLALFLVALLALDGWVVPLILILDAPLIALATAAALKLQADALMPPGRWSLRVTPDAIELAQSSRVIRLTAGDVDEVAVRPLKNLWFRFAVQARLDSGFALPVEAPDGWLPLFWTSRYSARVPRALISALAVSTRGQLDVRLAMWLQQQSVTDYEEHGTLEEVTTVSATLGWPLIRRRSWTACPHRPVRTERPIGPNNDSDHRRYRHRRHLLLQANRTRGQAKATVRPVVVAGAVGRDRGHALWSPYPSVAGRYRDH